MGLFDKKFCDICGDKIGLLGNRKLEGGEKIFDEIFEIIKQYMQGDD